MAIARHLHANSEPDAGKLQARKPAACSYGREQVPRHKTIAVRIIVDELVFD